MNYELIALDLDGTLLDSRKQIPEETVLAIRRAAEAGKAVAFCTGRAVPELEDPVARLPEVRFAVFSSGAGLYDRREKRAFRLRGIPPAASARILGLIREKDAMPQIVLPEKDVIQASHMARLERYHMGVYRPMYEKAMTLVPDIFAFAESCREPFLKINLYHADPAERMRTREQLAGTEMETAFSEVSSLECSARGVDKGSGLLALCGELGIPPERCIAVGDAENDLPMLRAAGLGTRLPRRVPSAEWPTWAPSERTCTTRAIPREIATHPFFFAALFSDVFFVLSRFGG